MEALLVLIAGVQNRSILFCRDKNEEREIWDGVRLGPEAAPSRLGVNEAGSISTLDAKLPGMLENKSVVWYPFATHKDLSARIETGLNAVRSPATAEPARCSLFSASCRS